MLLALHSSKSLLHFKELYIYHELILGYLNYSLEEKTSIPPFNKKSIVNKAHPQIHFQHQENAYIFMTIIDWNFIFKAN